MFFADGEIRKDYSVTGSVTIRRGPGFSETFYKRVVQQKWNASFICKIKRNRKRVGGRIEMVSGGREPQEHWNSLSNHSPNVIYVAVSTQGCVRGILLH